ncbi:MAG: Cna B-type domain-containing protein [Clostridia bacterium]|nr:Cna B-type domain-containing protein [Clostridia bacterium]
MRKKLISVLLVAAVVLGIAPLYSAADGSTGQTAKGEYTYTLTADPDTGTPPTDDIEPGGFGDIASNGRIWTDKSVAVNGDHFDVNLKVLAQEYVSTYSTSVTQAIAADVVMVLDFTSSMLRYKVPKKVINESTGVETTVEVTRMEALVDSVNEAIEIITTTNPQNRIMVYGYFGTRNGTSATNRPTVAPIMTLGHYTSTSTSNETLDKYITFTNHSSGNSYSATIASSDTLQKDGADYEFSQNTGTGTCTQLGIALGVKGLVDAIESETDHSTERKPYVILMTDGEPTWANKNWYSESRDVLTGSSKYVSYSSGGDSTQIVAAHTILTAAYWRERLRKAYETYNGKADPEKKNIEWFNIGLGVEEKEDYTGCLVNPYCLVDETASNASGSTEAEKVKYYIGSSEGAQAYTAEDFYTDDAYVYPNIGNGYVTFANTYEVLNDAFVTLANIIKMGSQNFTVPIVNHEGSGGAGSDMVFTDVIGQGMFITRITLNQNGAAPIEGVYDANEGVYKFDGYETTVSVTEDPNGQQTLEWQLPAKEVGMYTFADRNNVTNGEYIPADPTVLSYEVDFTDDIEEGPAYTNAYEETGMGKVPLTTVTYEIPGDNGYYFDVYTDADYNFDHSVMKTGLDGSTDKAENPTGTATTVNSYGYTSVVAGTGEEDTYAVVNGLLGNNGKVTGVPRTEMQITVEKQWEDENGNPITSTAGLPAVNVTLYRKSGPDGAEEEVPDINPITLNGSNDYSKTFPDLPIRDGNNVRYLYYIREDCPEGYYNSYISPAVQANDSVLIVKNREVPGEGALLVQKVWKNELGGVITDTENLPQVTVNMKRHVTKVTPEYYTVTLQCTDSDGKTVALESIQVKPGATLTYNFRIGLRNSSNANNAVLKLGDETITCATPNSSTVRVGNRTYTVWWKRPAQNQTLKVVENTTLAYTVNYRYNANVGEEYLLQWYDETPTSSGGNNAGTEHYDEPFKVVTLNNNNNWHEIENNLPLTENIDGSICTYKYYIEETSVPGYTISYSDNNTEGVTGGAVTVTNKAIAKIGPLPETGGRASPFKMEIIGFAAVLFSMAFFFMRYAVPARKKRRRLFKQNI